MIAEQAEDVVCDRYLEQSKQLYSPFKFKDNSLLFRISPVNGAEQTVVPESLQPKHFVPLSLPAPSRKFQGIKDVRIHETEVLRVSNFE